MQPFPFVTFLHADIFSAFLGPPSEWFKETLICKSEADWGQKGYFSTLCTPMFLKSILLSVCGKVQGHTSHNSISFEYILAWLKILQYFMKRGSMLVFIYCDSAAEWLCKRTSVCVSVLPNGRCSFHLFGAAAGSESPYSLHSLCHPHKQPSVSAAECDLSGFVSGCDPVARACSLLFS